MPVIKGEARPDRGRRLYGPTLLVGLLAGLGTVVGSARPWAAASATPPGLPSISVDVSGADLAPLAGALGLVVLAGFGAVVATRGWVRRSLGALIVAAACVVVVAAVVPGDAAEALRSELSAKGWSGSPYTTSTEPWRWIVLGSALVAAAAGALTAVFGGRWAVMGARYDAPGTSGGPERADAATGKHAADLTETEVWQAIDQGRDPTRDS